MPGKPQIERKLAAIMFTDIAGYTAQMSKDEAVAISLLNKKESVLKPLIAKHNGTYVKSTGDGSLSHFNSAVDAATCAKRFQESIYDDKDLNVRVGVHLGDTIFEKGDIRGDGVNIASRLESMAVEGGVFVSKEVHDQLTNQKEFEGVSLGLQSMKGVGRLIEVYGLKGDKLSEPNPSEYEDNKVDKHSDDEVPSIAIIPFDNKGKEEDAFYAYGISVDLISDVSSAGLIRVASKKQIDDVGDLPQDELAKKLDVRYMANGELWRMGDMFQLSVELYDTKDKKVVWSDRWQEKWDNLPTIKMNLSDGLLKSLDTKPKVEKMVETTNTEAYEFYLKAKHKYIKRENTDDTEIARGLLQKAIELDDTLIAAKVLLGTTYRETGDYDKAMDIFTSALKQAEELGDKLRMSSCLTGIGHIYSHKFEYVNALKYYKKSLKLCEELEDKSKEAGSLQNIANIHKHQKRFDESLKYFNQSFKLLEEIDDGWRNMIFMGIGSLYFEKGDCDRALYNYQLSQNWAKEFGNILDKSHYYHNCGLIYAEIGDYDKALDYTTRTLNVVQEIGDKWRISISSFCVAKIYYLKNNYTKALEYLEEHLALATKIQIEECNHVWKYLCFKNLNQNYNKKEALNYINDMNKSDEFGFEEFYESYLLFDNLDYINSAYSKLFEKVDKIESTLKLKFLSYPIPKAIVEEWEKVK